MKDFYITIKNGLLDPKHIKAMGGDRNIGTVWLFMWLLDKMTLIDTSKGEGKVLGGKPIKYEEVKQDLGVSRSTYNRWLDMLRKGGYIDTLRTPYGLVITVYKAFKVFGQRSVSKDTSNIRDKTHLPKTYDTSNKTIQLDNTVRHKEIYKENKYSSMETLTEPVLQEIAEKYNVSVGFVRLQREKLENGIESRGYKYKNFKRTLMNWVLSAMERQIERRSNGISKVSIDASQL